MSASPTRVEWPTAFPVGQSAFPLQEGNRVLESLARQDALQALLSFSDLHQQIRNRGNNERAATDSDLFQTECFVLDEVLQLVCDRLMTITHADGVLIALEEGSAWICRASAGPMSVVRGVRLSGESEFLQDALDSGRILRCDDCDIDARVEDDIARQIGARSTVLLPLRGARVRMGVLQAFSVVPFAFTDDDVRCLDLFGELLLSALKPEDQDRRLSWLTNVVEDVLGQKGSISSGPSSLAVTQSTFTQPICDRTSSTAPGAPEGLSLPVSATEGASDSDTVAAPQEQCPDTNRESVEPGETQSGQVNHEIIIGVEAGLRPETSTELEPASSLPVDSSSPGDREAEHWRPSGELAPAFLAQLSNSRRIPHPGLRVVFVLVAVAALFSAGVWFGMRQHSNEATKPELTAASPGATRIPAGSASDHLMDAASVDPSASATKLSVLPKITGVRHWSTPMGSTVVIDMQDQAPYEVHRLMSPERIYFDIHDTALANELDGRAFDVGDVALSRVRVGQPVPGVTRVVLDTRDGSSFSVSMESNPHRLVVELRAADRALASNRAEGRTAAALSPFSLKPEDSQLPAKAGRLRIALDAGHGGWDLGTVGRNGLQEKDLVLDVTRRLGRLLQARLGSEVIFTRTADIYLPLDERADFANQAQADLFVSVHANYSSAASARGVETFFTNTFTAPGTRDTENPESTISPAPMPVSLAPGELHEKIEESRRLAASIQRSLFATLASTSPGIRDRGVKDSQFVVLTGTTMPSILTEISFVSSPADERNLQSETYRQQIAEALYKGIARYATAAKRPVKVAKVQQAVVSSQ